MLVNMKKAHCLHVDIIRFMKKELIITAVLLFLIPAFAQASDSQVIDISAIENGKYVHALFNFQKPVDVKTFSLSDPLRFIVDVHGAALERNNLVFAVDSENVEKVRVSQYSLQPDIVRIVFDLKHNCRLKVVGNEDDGKVEISESRSEQFPDISIKNTSGMEVISIPFGKAPKYTVGFLANPNRMYYDFANYVPREPLITNTVGRSILKSVRISYFNNNPDTTRLVMDTVPFARTDVFISDKGTIEIRVFRNAMFGKTICIDPGHGGKDPGAVADDGTLEKDLTLDIALKLKGLLEDAGAKVIMTRTKDVFISLGERAAVANRAHADIFISVHINAVKDRNSQSGARGVQMYYCGDSGIFAKVMQKEVSDILATGDSGTFERRFAVLRRTNMPAVLAEIGFLSNPDDIALLKNETFRHNAARGIFNGLEIHLGGHAPRLAAIDIPQSVAMHLPAAKQKPTSVPLHQIVEEDDPDYLPLDMKSTSDSPKREVSDPTK